MMKCRICESSINTPMYKVREMYFGTRDEFEYQQCAACDCLQIVVIPDNLSQYYPEHYYSKRIKQQYLHKASSALREFKLNACLGKRRLVSLVLFFLRKPRLPPWIAYIDINSRSRILDVGCGAGKLLLKLGKKGFRYLEGVDPFIDETITYANGVKIYKNQIWNKENWVQLDSPRHLYLHSIKSMGVLAQKHGCRLQVVHFDSTRFQFTGSERYRRDITLFEKEEDDVFSAQEIRDYSLKADKLNSEGTGDQACFIFRKAS